MKLNYSKSVEKSNIYTTNGTTDHSRLSNIFQKNEYPVNRETTPSQQSSFFKKTEQNINDKTDNTGIASQQNNNLSINKDGFINIPFEENEDFFDSSSISIWKQQPLEEINNYLSKLLTSYPHLKTEILKIFYLATKTTLKIVISKDFNNYTNYVKNYYDDSTEDTKFLKKLFFELTESDSLMKQYLEIICNPYYSSTNNLSVFNKTYQKIHTNICYYFGKECGTATSEKLLKLIISKADLDNLKENKTTVTYIDHSIMHLKDAVNFLKTTKKNLAKIGENEDLEKNIFHLKQHLDILELPIITKLDINNIINELITMHNDLNKSTIALNEIQKTLDKNSQLNSIINIVAQKISFISGFSPHLKAAFSELNKITKISKSD